MKKRGKVLTGEEVEDAIIDTSRRNAIFWKNSRNAYVQKMS